MNLEQGHHLLVETYDHVDRYYDYHQNQQVCFTSS